MSASTGQPGETGTRYNPRLASAPGEPIEVTVDLPDDATDEDMFAAMAEAAELVFPGITGRDEEGPALELPTTLLPGQDA